MPEHVVGRAGGKKVEHEEGAGGRLRERSTRGVLALRATTSTLRSSSSEGRERMEASLLHDKDEMDGSKTLTSTHPQTLTVLLLLASVPC